MTRLVSLYKTFDDWLAKVERILLCAGLSVMVLLSFTQVVLRNMGIQAIDWADGFVRALFLWVGMIGASLATRSQRHIAIDVASNIVSKSALRYLRVITGLFAAAVSVFLMRASISYIEIEKDSGIKTFLDLPEWIIATVLPVAFALIALRFFALALMVLGDDSLLEDTHQGKEHD
jgi:TRAP-type C4-dicarboxylate transport system permease small subunit